MSRPPGEAPDRKVTASVLKAAASNPSEMLEVLRAEARAKRPVKPSAPASPTTDALLTSTALFKRALAGKTQLGGVQPRAKRPAAVPSLDPAPPAPPSAPEVRPAPAPVAAPAPVPPRAAPTIVVRRPASWPLASAVLLAGVAVSATLWLRPAPAPTVISQEAPPTPAPLAPVVAPPANGLAPLANGRVVQRSGDDLLILALDDVSGELLVERVYRLTQDGGRYLSQPGKRNPHGYYLDDRSQQALEDLAQRERTLARTVQAAVDQEASLDDAEARARAVVEAGGAPRLVKHLSGNLSSAEASVYRLAVTLALAEEGYLIAVEPLAGLLDAHSDNAALSARLTRLGTSLTGVRLADQAPSQAADRLRAWVAVNPLPDRFARVE